MGKKMDLDMERLIKELDKGDRDLYRLLASIIFEKDKEDISDFERTLAKLRCLDIATRPVTPLEITLVESFMGRRVIWI